MTYSKTVYRPGLTALVAVLALSATPALAQEVVPTPTPTPTTTTVAPDAATPAPTSETMTIEATTTAPAADPLAPSVQAAPTVAPTVVKSTSTTTRTTRTRRPVASTPVARTPAATAAPTAAALSPAEPAQPAPAPIAAAPVIAPAPVAATPVETASASNDDWLPIVAAGIGALGLLGAGIAFGRRKRRRDEEDVALAYEQPRFVAPVAAAPVEAPAFAWAETPAAAASPVATPASLPEGVQAEAGSHVAAAYAGPSPNNPSLSLKTRLKRAAFFDQRERLVAQGKAEPLARDAGLPTAIAASARRRAQTNRPARSMSFGYRPAYQPA